MYADDIEHHRSDKRGNFLRVITLLWLSLHGNLDCGLHREYGYIDEEVCIYQKQKLVVKFFVLSFFFYIYAHLLIK